MLRSVRIFPCLMALFLLVGCLPGVTITSPEEGTKFILGDSITFRGMAYSGRVVMLTETDSLDWYVDDKFVHTGSSYTTDTLTLGDHTILISRYLAVLGVPEGIHEDSRKITVIAPRP